MVAPGDIDGIGESLISLIEAPDERAQYGEALYKLVTSKFGIKGCPMPTLIYTRRCLTAGQARLTWKHV